MLETRLERQQAMLLSNGLARSQALMLGKSTEHAAGEKAPTASKVLDPLTLARHRSFPGNRPSTTLLLDQLTPRSLGALIALYEHRVFVSGAVSRSRSRVSARSLLCGDALAAVFHAAVVSNERAQMCIRDPPYNVPIDGHVFCSAVE